MICKISILQIFHHFGHSTKGTGPRSILIISHSFATNLSPLHAGVPGASGLSGAKGSKGEQGMTGPKGEHGKMIGNVYNM